MATRTQKLVAEIKAWADAQRGRRSELAELLGVSRQAVSDWFRPASGKAPSTEQALAIREFLEKLNAKEVRRHKSKP